MWSSCRGNWGFLVGRPRSTHADFEQGPDAVVAGGGSGEAVVKGDVTYEEAPGGRGIRLPEGASLRYLSEGNIDPQRGKLQIKFKPLWHGGDGVTRYFMTISPQPGHIYFGKLNDGRYIYNMFDVKGKQHWPWSPMKSLEPGGWHDAMVAWDADEGMIQLYFDGEKTAEMRDVSWKMGKLNNNVEKCRIAIGGSPIVIDEINIWARP